MRQNRLLSARRSAASLTHTLTALPVVMASAEKILFDLDPQYDDQLLPFCVSERRVKEVCDYRRFENSDLMNLKIAVAGFGALIEVANLVMGARD